MAFSTNLLLNLPTFSSTPTRIVPLSALQSHKRVFCSFPSRQYSSEHDNQENGEKEDSHHCRLSKSQLDASRTLLVERYDNGTVKRYILDNESWIQIVLEEHGYAARGLQMQEATTNAKLSWVPQIVKDFILPTGFPESVSEDYLEYMLLQFPTNLTAWICHTLVTSSLLKAVGVGSFSGTSAAASAAAVRWVSKDGLGAIGRLFIGGRFGNLFDDDPKQWRMYADFVGSAGSIFELTTQLYPAYFLPLASLGNLTKAVARGLKDPSFRVIQNHFSISGNLGEVAAKEEVWEVAAQLLGLALGILVMDLPGLLNSYPMLVFTWLSMRGLHLWLRYQSLSVLRFNTINLKRARALAKSHVLYSTVPGYAACNKEESILTWERFLKPRIIFGVSFEEIIGGKVSSSVVEDLLKLYSKEQHILVLSRTRLREVEIFVSFKVEATSITVLRSLWQAYWLYEHWRGRDHIIVQLKESLLEMEGRFDDFLQQLNGAGWDTNKINLKVPNEFVIETPAPLSFDSDQ